MIAIVPARGGSKGIHRKNLCLLAGLTLVEHAIRVGAAARSIDKVIVSTDDIEIANVSRRAGAEVPFLRPAELATDASLAIDAYLYTLDRLCRENGTFVEAFTVLHPTSPLRTAEDVDGAVALFQEKRADSVISICDAPYPPLWARRLDAQGRLSELFGVSPLENRQQGEQTYIPNGAVYVFRYAILRDRRSYLTERSYGYIMPRERSLDIDDPLDLEVAGFLMDRKSRTLEDNVVEPGGEGPMRHPRSGYGERE